MAWGECYLTLCTRINFIHSPFQGTVVNNIHPKITRLFISFEECWAACNVGDSKNLCKALLPSPHLPEGAMSAWKVLVWCMQISWYLKGENVSNGETWERWHKSSKAAYLKLCPTQVLTINLDPQTIWWTNVIHNIFVYQTTHANVIMELRIFPTDGEVTKFLYFPITKAFSLCRKVDCGCNLLYQKRAGYVLFQSWSNNHMTIVAQLGSKFWKT